MAKTLLNGVNEVLKRVQATDSDNAITALTGNAKQATVDIAVQVLNEVIDQLYEEAKYPLPKSTSSSSITLVTGTKSYALQSNLVRLQWPLLDQTNGKYLYPYPGGYLKMFESQDVPANYTGESNVAAINPEDGLLYLEKTPTANENGRVYAYNYEYDFTLSSASDTFPFSDAVFRAVVPAAAQMVKAEMQNKFNEGLFRLSIGRAARLLKMEPQRDSYLPSISPTHHVTDPYAD